MVAVPEYHAVPAGEEPRLGGALGVEPDELEPAAVEEGDEGEVVILGHRVVDGDEKLVFDFFAHCGVGRIWRFRLERRQRDPAAGNHRRAGGVEYIPADRADVEAGS